MKQPKRILIVDDEDFNQQVLADMVESLGHATEIARDGIEAMAKLTLDVDLILLDAMMPQIDGFEVAQQIREDSTYGNIPIIMVTALTSKEDRLRAVEAGANDFITKPIDKTELRVRMTSLLKMKEALDAIKQYQITLEETIEKRTKDLRQALESMTEAQKNTYDAYLDTIRRLSIAAEYKDEDTAGHLLLMSRYSALLARHLNLPPGEVELIYHASSMHDVGKIGVPDSVLLKPSKFDPNDWVLMKRHTLIGSHILKNSPSKLLQAGEIIARTHHER
jgi:putative two-component system response regulator